MMRPSVVERPATCLGRWGTSSCAVQYGDRYIPGAIRSCGLRFGFAAESRIPATEGPRARYDSSSRELAALNEQDSTPYVPKTDEERNEADDARTHLVRAMAVLLASARRNVLARCENQSQIAQRPWATSLSYTPTLRARRSMHREGRSRPNTRRSRSCAVSPRAIGS
jgi:hypothetical protein